MVAHANYRAADGTPRTALYENVMGVGMFSVVLQTSGKPLRYECSADHERCIGGVWQPAAERSR